MKENETVTQGQPLVTLDASRFTTRQAQLQGSIQQNLQQSQQVAAQLTNLTLQVFL